MLLLLKNATNPVVHIKKWFNISERTINRIWSKYKKQENIIQHPTLEEKANSPHNKTNKSKTKQQKHRHNTLGAD
ncbi:MAG: hypothetical protein LBE70_02860 [Nitrososphaerota archaeon]|jgi:ribosomal protein S6|nr:hypothetical protein [Nitrososphaerota archaeon]